jgi:tetratricopeptide (TPR) repeat protein
MSVSKILKATAILCLLPVASLAAGSESSSPPKATETTKTCAAGYIYDAKKARCVVPAQSSLDEGQLYDIVRELAYAGRLDTASSTLDQFSNQKDDWVLTYRGFIARKSGDFAKGEKAYLAALEMNPENVLARSYLGQGYVVSGDNKKAKLQLAAIKQIAGTDNWPYRALARSIRKGASYDY